jgi:hypothetical protein
METLGTAQETTMPPEIQDVIVETLRKYELSKVWPFRELYEKLDHCKPLHPIGTSPAALGEREEAKAVSPSLESTPTEQHEEDCPCFGDSAEIEHSKECKSCTCEPPVETQDIWDEEMKFSMTRGAWADLLEGKPIGTARVISDGVIRVERRTEREP